jgi:large subunit ribosomal protein L30
MSDKKLRITLVKSPIGYPKRQKATVKALGLGKMNSSVLQNDTPPIRGMIHAISHLVKVEELES